MSIADTRTVASIIEREDEDHEPRGEDGYRDEDEQACRSVAILQAGARRSHEQDRNRERGS